MLVLFACDLCGKAIRSDSTREFARCHPCRRVASLRRVIPPALCIQCGEEFRPGLSHGTRISVTCSKRCAQHLRVGREVGDLKPGHNSRRSVLESSQPGLTRSARVRLLHRWIYQGRDCAYCMNAATTVDHVVPLFRGGTNFEGNLAPACRQCNASKGRWLLVEWRRTR
jgi:5-methylcytosine-specific restriction endonuclease McrA